MREREESEEMLYFLARETKRGQMEDKADVVESGGGNARSSVLVMLEKSIRHPRMDLSKQIECLNLESRKDVLK